MSFLQKLKILIDLQSKPKILAEKNRFNSEQTTFYKPKDFPMNSKKKSAKCEWTKIDFRRFTTSKDFIVKQKRNLSLKTAKMTKNRRWGLRTVKNY